jgi:hypothetical protein
MALKGRLPKDEWAKIKPKHRSALLIWCHDSTEEENKGPQIWVISYFFFGEKLDEITKITGPTGIIGVRPYYDPNVGESIVFSKVKKGKDNVEYIGHRFQPRLQPIPDWVLDKAYFHLDDCFKLEPTQEEMYQAFYGKPHKEGETAIPVHLTTQAAPSPSASPTPEAAATPSTPPPPPPPVASSPTQVAPQPTPQAATTVASPSPSSTGVVCPGGGRFGVDFNSLDLCKNECPVWDNCADESERLERNK